MINDGKEKLIECVPNFSEGRNLHIVEEIRRSILDVSGCEIWDHGSDADHNRSVFTIAGDPDAIAEASFRFTKRASDLIDMETHTGVHPCIGATDVIPFVPLKNTTIQDCIDLSEKVGKRIAAELEIPVYLYAQSAKVKSHIRLADIRKGGYFLLKQEISSVPDRFPDFGPRILRSAGGVSVGARDFLIAFNVYLNTDDIKAARIIARKIRESSGGLPALQAIGLYVKGRAQVSMNLLNFRKTSLKTVMDSVSNESYRLGVKPLYSELIGMIPRDALKGTEPEELLLRDFSSSRILEEHY